MLYRTNMYEKKVMLKRLFDIKVQMLSEQVSICMYDGSTIDWY